MRYEAGDDYGDPGWTWVYPKVRLPDQRERMAAASAAGAAYGAEASARPDAETGARWLATATHYESFGFLEAAYRAVSTADGLRAVSRLHFEWLDDSDRDGFRKSLAAERAAARRRLGRAPGHR